MACNLKAVPMSFRDVSAYVSKYHRHHAPVRGDRFRLGVIAGDQLVGVIQVGNPVNRELNDGWTCEVVRCCTDGTRNACSFLYSRAARIAKELGYKKIITYILQSEMGTSLKASGWHLAKEGVGGGTWIRSDRLNFEEISLFDRKPKYSTEKKQRWEKELQKE